MESASLNTKQSNDGDHISTPHLAAPEYEGPAKSISNNPGESLSPEECEKLVLSPPPVPINMEVAAAAIYAAACRSNHSRNHSLSGSTRSSRVSKNEAQGGNECRKSLHEEIPRQQIVKDKAKKPGWRRFFCCFSDQKSRKKVKSNERVDHFKKSDDTVSCSGTISSTGVQTDSPLILVDDLDRELPHSGSVIPATVLNALNTEPTDENDNASPLIQPDINQSSQMDTMHLVNVKPHSPKSHGFWFSGLKRSNNADGHPIQKQSDYSYSYYPQNDEGVDQYVSTGQHQQFVIHQQSPPSYLDGDNVNTMQHYSPRRYVLIPYGDEAQEDVVCENSDSLPPGIDLLGEVSADCVNKKCLVLDLDETLVHSSFKYVENADFIVPVEINGAIDEVFVRKRPYLDKFLKAVGPLFECVMFTASLRKYADPVCDHIDQTSCFRHRLFREACVDHQNNLIKDLSRLGRDIDQICIVDNSPISFLFQPNNALHIISWFGDTRDQALLELIPYLTGLASADSVVDYLREFCPPQKAAVAQYKTHAWLLLLNVPQEQNEPNSLVDVNEDDAAAADDDDDEEEDDDQEEEEDKYNRKVCVLKPDCSVPYMEMFYD